MFCLLVCPMCLRRPEKVTESPGTGVTEGCEQPCGNGTMSSGVGFVVVVLGPCPLEEQPVHLTTTEPCL